MTIMKKTSMRKIAQTILFTFFLQTAVSPCVANAEVGPKDHMKEAIRQLKDGLDKKARELFEQTVKIKMLAGVDDKDVMVDLSRVADGFVTFRENGKDGKLLGMMQRSLDGRTVKVFSATGELLGALDTGEWIKWGNALDFSKREKLKVSLGELKGAKLPLKDFELVREGIGFFWFLMALYVAFSGAYAAKGDISLYMKSRWGFTGYMEDKKYLEGLSQEGFQVMAPEVIGATEKAQFPLQSGAAIDLVDGTLVKILSLPGVKRMGANVSMSLMYRSDMAMPGHSRLVRFKGDFSKDKPPTGTTLQSVTVELWNMSGTEPAKVQCMTKSVDSDKVEGALEWKPGEDTAPGIYPFEVRLTKNYSDGDKIVEKFVEPPVKTLLTYYDEAYNALGAGWNLMGQTRIIPLNTATPEAAGKYGIRFNVRSQSEGMSIKCVPVMLNEKQGGNLDSRGYITLDEFEKKYSGLPPGMLDEMKSNWCAVAQDGVTPPGAESITLEDVAARTAGGVTFGGAVLFLDGMGGMAILKPYELVTATPGDYKKAPVAQISDAAHNAERVLYRRLPGDSVSLVKTKGGLSAPGEYEMYTAMGKVTFDSDGYMVKAEAEGGGGVSYYYYPAEGGTAPGKAVAFVDYSRPSDGAVYARFMFCYMSSAGFCAGSAKDVTSVMITDPAGRNTVLEYNARRLMKVTLPEPGGGAPASVINYTYYDTPVSLPPGSPMPGSPMPDFAPQYLLKSSSMPNGALSEYSYYEGRASLKKYTGPSPSGDNSNRGVVEFYPEMLSLLQTPVTPPYETASGYDTVWVNKGAVAPEDKAELKYRTNEYGSVTESIDQSGRVTKIWYNSDNNPVLTERPDGSKIVNQYDVFGRLINTNSGNVKAARPTTYVYNARGMLLRRIDHMGRETEYVYDDTGRPLEIRGEMGLGTKLAYEDIHVGMPTRKTDLYGNGVSFVYNVKGNVINETSTDGESISYEYDKKAYEGVGLVTKVVNNKSQKEVARLYDNLGRTLRVEQAGDNGQIVQCYGYDVMGNNTWVLDSVAFKQHYGGSCPDQYNVAPVQASKFVFDALGREIEYYKPYLHGGESEVSRTFKLGGLLATTKDRQGLVQTYNYDASGRLKTVQLPSFGNYSAKTITYSDYDDNLDMPRQVTDGETYANYEFEDITGYMTKITTGGSFSDGLAMPDVELSFTYNDDGQRQSMSERYRPVGGSWTTPFGQTTSGGTLSTAYSYDRVGRLDSIAQHTQQRDTRSSYYYDETGKLSQSATYTRKQDGGYTNVAHSIYSFDPAGRLTGLENLTRRGLVSSYAYHYDASGYRDGERIRNADIDGNLWRTYSYDSMGQLTKVSHFEAPSFNTYKDIPFNGDYAYMAEKENYTYDGMGNRKVAKARFKWDAGYQYGTGAERGLLKARSSADGSNYFSYIYDYRGSMTNKQFTENSQPAAWDYSWDVSGRMISAEKKVSQDTKKVVKYYYDILGRRVAKRITENGAVKTTKYAYDGIDILYEFNGSGALSVRHTHGPGADNPLYTQTAADFLYFYQKDGLGSVKEITNEAGYVVQRLDYDSFGNITKDVKKCGYDGFYTFTFTGRQWDAEIDMFYYRARYYDASVGRFISEDPIFAMNRYAYCGNDPVNMVDPSGKSSDIAWLIWLIAPSVYYDLVGITSPDISEYAREQSLPPSVVDGLITLQNSSDIGRDMVEYLIVNNYEMSIIYDKYLPDGDTNVISSKDGSGFVTSYKFYMTINLGKEDSINTNDSKSMAFLLGHETLHGYKGVLDNYGNFIKAGEYWIEKYYEPTLASSIGTSDTEVAKMRDIGDPNLSAAFVYIYGFEYMADNLKIMNFDKSIK